MAEWRDIAGYEGKYQISDDGRVKSLARTDRTGRCIHERILKPGKTTSGHLQVSLCADGTSRAMLIHRLVATAFLDPPESASLEVCHNNGVPGDNRLANLRWDTRSENALDLVRSGAHHMTAKTHCPSGHEYTPENTYLRQGKWRTCRECYLAMDRERDKNGRRKR